MFPLRDSKTSNKFPFVNLSIIAVNLYFFIQELLTPNLDLFIETYALIPSRINFSFPETLFPFFTSIFLHAGFLHIISNMWFLWVFGDNIEARLGHIKFLVFYVFCGVAASFLQYLFISDSNIPMLGASGAIAGVLGAYLKFFPKNSVDTIIPIFGLPIILAVPASFMLIYWFFTQAFNSFAAVIVDTAAVGGIAYIAHAGGFLAGALFSPLFVWQKGKN